VRERKSAPKGKSKGVKKKTSDVGRWRRKKTNQSKVVRGKKGWQTGREGKSGSKLNTEQRERKRWKLAEAPKERLSHERK